MDNLLVGLIISAATGLTFIAYKHPKLFIDELSPRIINTLCFAIVCAVLYNLGATLAYNEFVPFIKSEMWGDARRVFVESIFGYYAFGSIFAAAIYVFFLNWLSSHMISQTSDPDETVPANDQD